MDWGKIASDMLSAAKQTAGQQWPNLKNYAEHEFHVLTQVAANIEARKLAGTISEVNARFLMSQYEGTARTVLFAVEGMTNLLIEQVINAALGVLRTAINKAIGWTLL